MPFFPSFSEVEVEVFTVDDFCDFCDDFLDFTFDVRSDGLFDFWEVAVEGLFPDFAEAELLADEVGATGEGDIDAACGRRDKT